ncbi:MAG: single-stranded DNA-binding protein [Phycisphaerae bacterium]|jgi:single-strand DNA-binding protein
MALNRVVVSGRLGKEPELDYLPSERAKISFNIANDVGWGDKKKTNWIPIVGFGTRAESLSKILKKGQEVIIEGKYMVDSWKTDDGQFRSKTYLQMDELHFTSGNGKSEAAPKKTTPKKSSEFDLDFEEDEEEDINEMLKKPSELETVEDDEEDNWMP